MTRVIKSDRPHSGVATLQLAPPTLPRTVRANQPSEITLLREKIKEQESALASSRSQIENARREGEIAGREAGLLEGKKQAQQNFEALKSGVSEAHAALKADLKECERIALALASEALERVLGPGASQKDLLTQIIKKQATALEAQTILHIDVSAADFPDINSTKPLLNALSTPNLNCRTSPSLKSGECRLKLRLGALEIGPSQQWASLSAAIATLGRSGDRP